MEQRFHERAFQALLRQHDLDLVDLASVPHVERELKTPAWLRNTVAVHSIVRLLLQHLERAIDASDIERTRLDVDLLVDVQDVGGGGAERAPGGGDRLLRDDHLLHAELIGKHARMRRPRSAEREQYEVPRIETLLDGHLADDVRHLELSNPGDAARRFHQRELERVGDALYRID